MANNTEYLKPLNTRTKEEQSKICAMGGKKSGEVRRQKKQMKEIFELLFEKEITNQKGEKATTIEAMGVSMIKQALKGNVRAFDTIMEIVGEKNNNPIINVNQAVQVNQQDLNEAVKIIHDLK